MANDINTRLGAVAFGEGMPAMTDPTKGGQQGSMINPSELAYSSAAIRRQGGCILLEAPLFIRYMKDPAKMYQAIKAFFELHSRTFEGISYGLKPEFDSHPIGGSGQVFQELVDMKREVSAPVHGVTELDGRPFQTLLDIWLRYGGMDPETKQSLIATTSQGAPKDFNMKWRTATVGYFETDLTGTIVTKAAIVANMFPMDQGPIEIKKDLTASQEIIVLSIPFTGFTEVGQGVTQYMQTVIDNIRKANAVPTLRPSPITAVSPDVQPGRGYKESIEDVGNTAVSGYRP